MLQNTTYKQAGVDTEAGQEFVNIIKPLAKSTHRNGVMGGLGGFAGAFDLSALDYKEPVLLSGTDGVGTKVKIAHIMDNYHPVGIDLVAMCVNDLAVQAADPLFFLDYFATSKLDIAQGKAVVSGIADGCRQAGCALIGGETAEMPGIYAPGEFDLAGFTVGIAEKSHLTATRPVEAGDIILGLPASGLHSNGFSLIRHLIKKRGLDYHAPAPFNHEMSLGEALLEPTQIYSKPALSLWQEPGLKAMAHITGGGFDENVPRVLPDDLAAKLDVGMFPALPVYAWLHNDMGLDRRDMLQTFNCGIGMVLIAKQEAVAALSQTAAQHGLPAVPLGQIIQREQHAVVYDNLEQAFNGR